MIEVELPAADGAPDVVRSFAACLASVIEAPADSLPPPAMDLPGSVGEWRSWLAGRGVGLVPIARAERFKWPGYWLAVIAAPETDPSSQGRMAVLMFGSPSGVVLSPQDPRLVGAAASDLEVEEGFVISALDPALVRPASAPISTRGTVALIAVAETATAPMRTLDTARALPGRGLAGDRYAEKAGTFTPRRGGAHGYDLTLIEAEAVDTLHLPGGERLGYASARRNLVTRGIDLNALVGRAFRVGDVECFGQRLCEPCAHLERLTTKGVLRGLIHRGGLRADVLSEGEIAVGAVIETYD